MTEGEAKTKWCPFARTVGAIQTTDHEFDVVLGSPVYNRVNAGPGFQHPVFTHASHCIGSACMAWRRLPEGEGYCGAAGMPR